jgi:hypothetical protein
MNLQHYQQFDAEMKSTVIQVATIMCPFCKNPYKVVIPDDCNFHNFEKEAKFLRDQNNQLEWEIIQLKKVQLELLTRRPL